MCLRAPNSHPANHANDFSLEDLRLCRQFQTVEFSFSLAVLKVTYGEGWTYNRRHKGTVGYMGQTSPVRIRSRVPRCDGCEQAHSPQFLRNRKLDGRTSFPQRHGVLQWINGRIVRTWLSAFVWQQLCLTSCGVAGDPLGWVTLSSWKIAHIPERLAVQPRDQRGYG